MEGWGQWQDSCVMCPQCTVKTQYHKTARLSDYRIAQKRYKSFYKRSTSVNLVHFQIHPSHDDLLTTSYYTTQDYTATHIIVLYPFVGQGRVKLRLISLSQAMCTRHCATQICTNYTTSSPSHDDLNPHLYIYISITLILIVNNIILFFLNITLSIIATLLIPFSMRLIQYCTNINEIAHDAIKSLLSEILAKRRKAFIFMSYESMQFSQERFESTSHNVYLWPFQ